MEQIQTCLEKKALEERPIELIRNDYNVSDEYSDKHEDALSNGDPLGKGTGNGGHTHSIPDCNKSKYGYDYSQLDTTSENIGGLYDIEGRNGIGGRRFLKTINLYNENNEYSANIVNMEANIADGQVVIKY